MSEVIRMSKAVAFTAGLTSFVIVPGSLAVDPLYLGAVLLAAVGLSLIVAVIYMNLD